jgi:hypothetical protein
MSERVAPSGLSVGVDCPVLTSGQVATDGYISALAALEAIVIKFEKLAAGGTHQDLPGNGQEQDTGTLYL